MKPSSSLSVKDSEYMTVNSAPPKHPSGRIKFRETRHPIYRGVRRRGTSNRWVCEVRNLNDKSRIWLGTFATAEMAARAHDVAAMALRGRSACLNFADSAWLIKLPDSLSNVNDIKKAAVEAAENFKCKDTLSLTLSSSEQSSVQETEEIITVTTEKTVNLEMDDDIEFNKDLGSYYANLARGIVSPTNWFDDLDDNNWGLPGHLCSQNT